MTMKDLTKDSLLIFQNGVRASFEFLEKEYLMVFTGVREIKEDPRDAGFRSHRGAAPCGLEQPGWCGNQEE